MIEFAHLQVFSCLVQSAELESVSAVGTCRREVVESCIERLCKLCWAEAVEVRRKSEQKNHWNISEILLYSWSLGPSPVAPSLHNQAVDCHTLLIAARAEVHTLISAQHVQIHRFRAVFVSRSQFACSGSLKSCKSCWCELSFLYSIDPSKVDYLKRRLSQFNLMSPGICLALESQIEWIFCRRLLVS